MSAGRWSSPATSSVWARVRRGPEPGRAVADLVARLPDGRLPGRRRGPAGPGAANPSAAAARARGPDRGRPGPAGDRRGLPRAGRGAPARAARRPARDVLRAAGRRVGRHRRQGAAGVAPGAHRALAQPPRSHRRGAAPSPGAVDRRRGVRALPAHAVRGPEALLAGRQRGPDPPARHDRRGGRGTRGRGDGAGDASPGPAQRAGPSDGQALRADPGRVRGLLPALGHPGRRRRQVPPGLLSRPRHPRRAPRPPVDDRQPEPPRGHRSRRARASCAPSRRIARIARASGSCPCSCTAMPPSRDRARSTRR